MTFIHTCSRCSSWYDFCDNKGEGKCIISNKITRYSNRCLKKVRLKLLNKKMFVNGFVQQSLIEINEALKKNNVLFGFNKEDYTFSIVGHFRYVENNHKKYLKDKNILYSPVIFESYNISRLLRAIIKIYDNKEKINKYINEQGIFVYTDNDIPLYELINRRIMRELLGIDRTPNIEYEDDPW